MNLVGGLIATVLVAAVATDIGTQIVLVLVAVFAIDIGTWLFLVFMFWVYRSMQFIDK